MPRRLVVEADGGSRGNPGPAGYGAVVRDADTGAVLARRADYLGVATNNVAEYSGLVAGLQAAREIDPDATIEVRMDSRLVVEQMRGAWKVKHDDMRRLAAQAREVVDPALVTWTWVPRLENSGADALANAAMDGREAIVEDVETSAAAEGSGGAFAAAASASASGQPAPGDRTTVRERPAREPTGEPMRFDDAVPVTVVLVRHGETPLTVTKAYSGSSVPGPPLTETGRAQARRAAALIGRIGRDLWDDIPVPSEVIASPMVRTQETAGVIAEVLGLPVRTEPLVAECDFGDWEGLTAKEIEARWTRGELKLWHDDASFRAPGGESIEDVGARMRAALEQIRRDGVDRTVVVVTHSVSVRTAVGVAIRAQSSAWARIRVAPASVSIVRLFHDGTSEVTVVGAPSDLGA